MKGFEFVKSIIPLGIYFIVEYLYGPWWGMAAGIILSLAEMVRQHVKIRKVERSFWIEVGMVLFFGITEIVTGAEAVKPFSTPIISVFISIMLALSVWTPFNIFGMAGGKMMDAVTSDPFRYSLLIDSLKRMFIWSVAFSAFSLFLALFHHLPQLHQFEKNQVWIVLILFFASEMLLARLRGRRYRNEEWLPIVNEEGKVCGRAPRSMFHNNTKWLHPVVHLHVITPNGLLLQKRPMSKTVQPGKWDTAVGGHVSAGESLEKALQREAAEEIGLKAFEARMLKQYLWESDIERELVFMFVSTTQGPFEAGFPEVEQLKEWSPSQLAETIGSGAFTPNLEKELRWIIPILEKKQVIPE
jgi:isopentenyldiphosphate isomerase